MRRTTRWRSRPETSWGRSCSARLFDTVGRRPMIAGTYILSGVLLLVTGYMFDQRMLSAALSLRWSVMFFFASAGVSAAYLTVSEISERS